MGLFSRFRKKETNFKYLDDLIKSGAKEIVLEYDIVLSDDEMSSFIPGIEISTDNLVIKGNGHSIDGRGKKRFFSVYGKNIVFEDIIFMNGYCDYGGAIYAYDPDTATCTFRNCEFRNNIATEKGGAIYLSMASLNIINCLFLSNNCQYDGGAIENNGGEVYISGSSFISNGAYAGGAIFNKGEITVENSEFKSNNSGYAGGAVVNNGERAISNYKDCRFLNNISTDSGGAIFNDNGAKFYLVGSEFYQNQVPNANPSSVSFGGDGLNDLFESVLGASMGGLFGRSSKGGAIFNNSEFIIQNSNFHSNSSSNGACLYNDSNGLCHILSNSTFRDNNIQGSGAAIYNLGKVISKDSDFTRNNGSIGGAIFNKGDLELSDGDLSYNIASLGGGAIAMDKESSSRINNSIFRENISAISNLGNLEIVDCEFSENTIESLPGSAINSGGDLKISSSLFRNNHNESNGGTIANTGKLEVYDSSFEGNSARFGSAVYNLGSGVLNIGKTSFLNNASSERATVFNSGELMIKDCDFRKSIARQEGLNILNENKMRIFSSSFIENQDILISINNIFNYGSLEVFDCIFEDNFLDSAIFNYEDANLSVSDSRFSTNFSNNSLIYNLSENCSLINLVFDNNESKEDFKANIYNKGHLLLSNPKVKNIHKKSIYNDGTTDIRKASQDFVDQNIHTPGVINLLTLFKEDIAKKEKESNFSKLDDLIHGSDDLHISLEDDYILDFYELGFYEGGIELDIDNLHINGNGRTIDGNNRSRIFLISGKNIVLENIRFKNGNFKSISEHANGGGVLRTLNGSSLILKNCEFLDNESDDDGGAIFNRGLIKSVNSSFNNNLSKLYGACIFNSGEYISIEDDFNMNLSKLGYQIYNQGELILDNSELSDISDFSVESFENDLSLNLEDRLPIDSKAIFNKGIIRDISLDNSDFIFNVGTIDDEVDFDYESDDLISIVSNRQTQLSKNNLSITDFISKMQSFDEIGLDSDVIFDFNSDNGFYKEIRIDKDMVIDGQGHSIDACGIYLMFNILSNNVVFKNLTFKNLHLLGNPLFNIESCLSLENCKFENIKTSNEAVFLNNGEFKVSDSYFLNNDLEDAAIFDNKSNLEISNSLFLNNNSLISLVFNGNDSSGFLRISNNVFFDNDITNQSSILNHFGKMSIDNSNFKYNSSNKGGGAIVNCSNGELDISDSDFINNSAEYGGALSNLGNMNVLGSSFKRNSVKQNMGGAISNSGHITVDNSFFRENYAKVIGSAINSSGGVLIVKNSKFYENKSDNPGFISIKEGSGYQLEANEAENNLPEDTAFLLK